MPSASRIRRGRPIPQDLRGSYDSGHVAHEADVDDNFGRDSSPGGPSRETNLSIRIRTDGLDPFLDQYSALVGSLREDLLRVARRILRGGDLAEDALQEAFLALWYEQAMPPNPTGWLIRAVVHRSLHLNRSQGRRKSHEERACCHRHEHETDPVSREIERWEAEHWLDEALAELPEEFRTVFVLREVEQMDYEAIASLLDIPIGTVRSRLNRSRRHLQTIYHRSRCGPFVSPGS